MHSPIFATAYYCIYTIHITPTGLSVALSLQLRKYHQLLLLKEYRAFRTLALLRQQVSLSSIPVESFPMMQVVGKCITDPKTVPSPFSTAKNQFTIGLACLYWPKYNALVSSQYCNRNKQLMFSLTNKLSVSGLTYW